MESVSTPQAALEALVADDLELPRLEMLLSQFNLFEALGVVRHELRHSDFLAFLLDPNRNHGFGDEFLRSFLQKVLIGHRYAEHPISLVDLDVWDLDATDIFREWQSIDILIVNKPNRLVVAIENKIGTKEHSDQLMRYRKIIEQAYEGWNALFIYLTPEGNEPSDETYLAVNYTSVCEAVENLLEKRASTLGVDVATLIRHYAQMLRRHIVNESEIAELCRRIYRKHRLALDLIFEHRPDELSSITETLLTLVTEAGLNIDTATKSTVRFAPKHWYSEQLTQGSGWTSSGQLLLFEAYNKGNELSLVLYLGPGPGDVRQTIFSAIQSFGPPLKSQSRVLNNKLNSIYRKMFLRPCDCEGGRPEDLELKVRETWTDFMENDLPRIEAAVEITGLI
jgi:hypothetical protein